ncbi:MAG TPA: SulP family inorganic anion transporter [Candidatus Binataceae bacterium]|nr:SulP family inorganic anion transporter [Candidatus Binataceae bacterium]
MPSFQMFGGVRPVTRDSAFRDALAGFQLAAMNIPQALGYTKIAGTPVITGLYTLLLPLVAFAAFGSSRFLVVAADSATAAILASGLGDLAPLASPQYVALAGTVALLTGVFLLIARLLKLGFLADFLSQTVLVGFLTGVGFQVGIAVVGELLGLEVHSQRSIGQLFEVVRGLPQVRVITPFISAVVVTVILGLHWLAPKVPGALIAVAGAIAASVFWDLGGHGVAIVGPVIGGLPRLGIPSMTWSDINRLVPIAGSCVVMIVAQSAATARFYATRHQQRLDEDADLIGLSAANAAAALSGTFVVDGSPTQTAMVESSGGQSQLAQIATAAVVALVLLFLTKPLQYLPRCALGAVVFVIATRLVDLGGLRDIQRESPGEFALALLTAAIVVLIGVEPAIILAMVLSLFRVLNHSYHPQTGVLAEGEQGLWETKPAVAQTVTEPGLVIYRFGAALFYANAGLFAHEVRMLARGSGVRWLVVDAEAITNVDYSAARMLRDLNQYLKQINVEFSFARTASSLRADLIRHRVIEAIGEQRIFPRLHNATAAFRVSQRS